MSTTTTNDVALRQAEIARAARHAIVQMRAMIEEGHAALDDLENIIDSGKAPESMRAGIEKQRDELELFEEMADAYEQGRLNKAARASFAYLLGLPTTH